jgi:nucleotide-binding universal stress UspA family protein
VLHVVPPAAPEAGGARDAVHRVFDDPAQPTPVQFQVVQDASPVDAVLREAHRGYDLVIIGVSEEWGLESHLFGFRPERIAEQVNCSLLIVRKHTSAVASQLDAENFAAAASAPSTSPSTLTAPPGA